MSILAKFPDSHLRSQGRHVAQLDDGTPVLLEISTSSRALRGHEMFKAAMSMQMGRSAPMRVEETCIGLLVGRGRRIEIEVTASGQYRAGRRLSRSLRDLCELLVDEVRIKSALNTPLSDDEAPPSFSR